MKRFLLLAALFVTCLTSAQDRASLLREKLIKCDTSSVLVTAHRGDWRYAPENSVAAIEHSIAVGVDIVEVDLQLTADSVLILMHDATLDRTTTGRGNISEKTLAEIKKLYLRNGCAIRTPHRVPTLEEALTAVKGKVLINLDKADRYFDLVVPILEKTGTTAQVVMKGSKPAEEVLSLYGRYLDRIIYMPIMDLDSNNAFELMQGYMEQLHPTAYEFLYRDDSNKNTRDIRKTLQGTSLIWYNTLWDTMCGSHDDEPALTNPDAAYGYLIDTLGARIIQTDRAELLLNYLKGRGLHE